MSATRWWCVFALGALGACSSDDAAPAAPTARELLDEGQTFLVDADASSASWRYSVRAGDAVAQYVMDARIAGGVFVGMLDDAGNLVLDELVVNHDAFPLDVAIEARGSSAWIEDLELRGSGRLAFPDTLWSEDGEIAMTADAAGLVTMQWDVTKRELPTASFERGTAIDTSAILVSDDDVVTILFDGATAKVGWSWSGVTMSSQLELSLVASIPRE